MYTHEVTFPGESAEYRSARNTLLAAEADLRAQVERVAELRRQLPPGALCADYVFDTPRGPRTLVELFEGRDTLLVYTYMFKGADAAPCPMCGAFMDSLSGQVHHVLRRTAMVVAARAPMHEINALVAARHWQSIPWVSTAGTEFPKDYWSEMPDGSQLPMCHVFVRNAGEVRHFWSSELFFVPWEHHPRHVDMLWPLWHFFDLLPGGRGDFALTLGDC